MSPAHRLLASISVTAVTFIAGWSASVYAPLQAATGFVAPPVAPAARPLQIGASAEAPRRQINSVYAEYPPEALDKKIAGTVVVTITINPAGQVSTAAVASGPAELRASAFKAAMGLRYAPGPSTNSATVYVEYRLDPESWGVRVGESAVANRGTTVFVQRPRSGPPALRVGGEIRAPKKLKDVPPEYPADAQAARVQGVVIMEITVDGTGSVGDDVKVLRSIPLLDQAAIEAVRQWQYEPTLLNGAAVPVTLTVTISFSLRGMDLDVVTLIVTLPDGERRHLEIQANSEIGIVVLPAGVVDGTLDDRLIKFGFALSDFPGARADAMRLGIFRFSEPGTAATARRLEEIEVQVGEPARSTTVPSFGIELVKRERRPR